MTKLIGIVYIGLLFAISGCENEGPAERAGERIDQAVEDARQQAQDVGGEVEQLADDVVDEFDRARDNQ